MTVKELISRLSQMDQGLDVALVDYSDLRYLNEVRRVEVVNFMGDDYVVIDCEGGN